MGGVARSVEAEPIIRVVSWNMKWFPGGSPTATGDKKREQMAAAQEALKGIDPDIVLLQEVADYKAVEELVSVLNDFKVQVVSTFQGRPQNLAIATRLPTVGAWFDRWAHTGATEPPRGYAFAAIELPDKRLLLAYSLHLKSNLGQLEENIAKRTESAQQFLEHAAGMVADYGKERRVALLVGGDFNTSSDDEQFAAEATLKMFRQSGLEWAYEDVPKLERVTIPASGHYPDNCFDHIFSGGLGHAQAKVIQVPGVSDHNPVIFDFDAAIESPLKLQVPVRPDAVALSPTR